MPGMNPAPPSERTPGPRGWRLEERAPTLSVQKLDFFIQRHLRDHQISPLIRGKIFVFPWALRLMFLWWPELRLQLSGPGEQNCCCRESQNHLEKVIPHVRSLRPFARLALQIAQCVLFVSQRHNRQIGRRNLCSLGDFYALLRTENTNAFRVKGNSRNSRTCARSLKCGSGQSGKESADFFYC